VRVSRWVVAREYSVKRRSRRFVVEADGSRVEVAASRVYLLALLGEGWITTGALELAYGENVCIAFIGDRLAWFEPKPIRGVEYLIAQFKPERGAEVAESIRRSWIAGAGEFLKKLGRRSGASSVEELRGEVRGAVASYLGATAAWIERLEGVYRRFLEAECLSALLNAGLSPHLSLSGREPVLEEFSLEFEFQMVWEPMLSAGRAGLTRVDLSEVSALRSALRYAKDRLEGLVAPHTTLRSLIWRKARALASSLLNPLMSYEAGWRS